MPRNSARTRSMSLIFGTLQQHTRPNFSSTTRANTLKRRFSFDTYIPASILACIMVAARIAWKWRGKDVGPNWETRADGRETCRLLVEDVAWEREKLTSRGNKFPITDVCVARRVEEEEEEEDKLAARLICAY